MGRETKGYQPEGPKLNVADPPQGGSGVPNYSEMPKQDERYYVPCPKRKNKARIAVTLCFDCEFATRSAEGAHVEIGCGYPVGRIMKKNWRRKGSNVARRPAVNKIERDGLS